MVNLSAQRLFAVASALSVALAALLLAPPTSAQPAPDDRREERFVFCEVEEGFLRMDRRSGQVSLCRPRGGGWSCQVVPDDRAALVGEISHLRAQIAELRQALADEAKAREAPAMVPPAGDGVGPTGTVPTAPGADRPPVVMPAPAPRAVQPAAPDGRAAESPAPEPPKAAEPGRTRAAVERAWQRLIEFMGDLKKELRNGS